MRRPIGETPARPFERDDGGAGAVAAAARRLRAFGRRMLPLAGVLLFGLTSLAPPAATPAAAAPVRIVALGDSLTAGYGLGGREAFPVRLEAALRERGHDVVIVNAGVSGDTASGGLARLDWSVGDDVDAVIVELGANDALRGVDPAVPRRALDEILGRLRGRGIEVLLAGMYAPPNLGEDYGRRFNAIYPELARKHGAILYPFFLDGVVGDAKLNLPDGIHPTAAGIDIIVERILPAAEELVARAAAKR